MLVTNLARVQGIDVLSTEHMLNVLQRIGKKDASELNPSLALEVARNARADVFVTGALLKVGPAKLRLDVRVQDTASGRVLFPETVEAESAQGVFAMVDALTARIAQRLLPEAVAPAKPPAIEEAATSNIEAYRHFQLGRQYMVRFLWAEATGKRDQAVNEYQEFASHFEGSRTRLPQVAEARAALKRLL